MNNEKNHTYKHERHKEACEAGYNLFLQSEGGSRNNESSATGWKVTAVDKAKTKVSCIARGGTFFHKGHSSLHIEVLALEKLINSVHNWLSYRAVI